MTSTFEEKHDTPQLTSSTLHGQNTNISNSHSQSTNKGSPRDLRIKLNASSKKSNVKSLQVTINNSNGVSSRTSSLSCNVKHSEAGALPGVMQLPVGKPSLLPDHLPVYEKMQRFIDIDTSMIHRLLILNSPDPVASFIITWAATASSTLSNSLSLSRNFLDSREFNNNFELLLDSHVVARIKGKKAIPLISSLEKSNRTRLKKVACFLHYKLLEYLLPRSWLVIRKELSAATKAVTSDRIQGTSEETRLPSKGHDLLKLIGWTEGTGLGSQGQGIKEPVAVETTINRQGLGFGDGSKPLRKCAGDFFRSYIQAGRSDMLVFSNEFSSDDRKVLHQLAQTYGLKSQSRGKGPNRCLTVTRKGVTLGAQIKELVITGTYNCDWCTIVPPGTAVEWQEVDI
ncbi:uncharacterized protein [Watersipora subatra]|uniref:uncharacterized protein n=1 Tax=Watersipora subatra TaxID=2589382 RepID=UPI00355C142E